jgi:hypothetical protein
MVSALAKQVAQGLTRYRRFPWPKRRQIMRLKNDEAVTIEISKNNKNKWFRMSTLDCVKRR